VNEGSVTSEDMEGSEGSTSRGLVLLPVAAAVTCTGVLARPCSPTNAHHTTRVSQLLLLLSLSLLLAAAIGPSSAAAAAAAAAVANADCALRSLAVVLLLPSLLLLLVSRGWGIESDCQRMWADCRVVWLRPFKLVERPRKLLLLLLLPA